MDCYISPSESPDPRDVELHIFISQIYLSARAISTQGTRLLLMSALNVPRESLAVELAYYPLTKLVYYVETHSFNGLSMLGCPRGVFCIILITHFFVEEV